MRMKALTCMQRLAPRDFKSSDVLLQRCIEDIHRVMTMRSFVLPPSCWRGWAGPSWGPWAAKDVSWSRYGHLRPRQSGQGAELGNGENVACERAYRLGRRRTQSRVGQSFLAERLGMTLTSRVPTPPDRPSYHARPGLSLIHI